MYWPNILAAILQIGNTMKKEFTRLEMVIMLTKAGKECSIEHPIIPSKYIDLIKHMLSQSYELGTEFAKADKLELIRHYR